MSSYGLLCDGLLFCVTSLTFCLLVKVSERAISRVATRSTTRFAWKFT